MYQNNALDYFSKSKIGKVFYFHFYSERGLTISTFSKLDQKKPPGTLQCGQFN